MKFLSLLYLILLVIDELLNSALKNTMKIPYFSFGYIEMVDSETEWFFTIVTDAGYEEIWCAGPTKADVHMNALLEKVYPVLL
ncbi:hypothetical protein L1987_50494 [Smallanthus sonchifolius]|uniref:Uncharacterized protein n=1 Tax=Smallanthus sonchifolius TaxID=185202 RepID=A0ACB9EM72_9ASTR|nr:hypothetical protein L1987_50494 [Smallanthus sonchifolius]